MNTRPCYLVIEQTRKGAQIVRVAQGWPSLEPGQATVRVSLTLPDNFLTEPVHVVEIDPDEITVAIAAEGQTP